MSDAPQFEIQITRSFGASPEQVFDAWLDPVLIARWMFSPALVEQEVVGLVLDAEVGGAFSFVVRRGGAEIEHVGTYLDLKRPRRLEFTWGIAGESAGESVVRIEIAPTAEGCEMTLTHRMDAKWETFAERTREGWTKMTGMLGEVLAEGAGTQKSG